MTTWVEHFAGLAHEDRVMTIVEDGSTLDGLIAEVTALEGAVAMHAKATEKAWEERERLREALVKVRAHTGYLEPADIVLLRGLLSSVERITEAALAGTEPPS